MIHTFVIYVQQLLFVTSLSNKNNPLVSCFQYVILFGTPVNKTSIVATSTFCQPSSCFLLFLFFVLTSEASWPCVSHINTPSPSNKGNARYTSVRRVLPLLRTSIPQLCKIKKHWRHKDVRLCTICSQIFSVMCGVHSPRSKNNSCRSATFA